MTDSPSPPGAAALLLLGLVLSGCGGSQPEADPAMVDQHINQILIREEAQHDNAVAAARAREAVREQEMEAKAANYSAARD